MTRLAVFVSALALAQSASPIAAQVDETRSQVLAGDAELAAAVWAVHPRAKGWTVRDDDSNWMQAGMDRQVWVDFPAVDVTGRVGWHRSSFCTRTRDEGTWTCSKRGKKSLLEVRPPADAPASAACPATTIRGIRVEEALPLETVAELTDYVRLGSAGPDAIDAMCRPSLEHWQYPELEFCDVASVHSGDGGTFDLALRIGSAHMLVLELEHTCDAEACETRLVDCHDIIA